MRYFCFDEYDENGGRIEVWSEEDIRKNYYLKHWYPKMCEKYEQSYVDQNFTFEDCIDDWIIVNNAWPSDNDSYVKVNYEDSTGQ